MRPHDPLRKPYHKERKRTCRNRQVFFYAAGREGEFMVRKKSRKSKKQVHISAFAHYRKSYARGFLMCRILTLAGIACEGVMLGCIRRILLAAQQQSENQLVAPAILFIPMLLVELLLLALREKLGETRIMPFSIFTNTSRRSARNSRSTPSGWNVKFGRIGTAEGFPPPARRDVCRSEQGFYGWQYCLYCLLCVTGR